MGLAGTIIGLIALAFAVLPLWILPAVFPPKSFDQVVVETAQRWKDRVVAEATGSPYRAPQQDVAADWYRACSIAAVSLGVLTIALASFSFLRREHWRYSGVAVALGTGAIAFELAVAALAVLIAFAILVAALEYLGIGL